MTIFPVWVIFSLPLDNKYNKTPFVRFVCNLTSHIYFMIIQICVACWPIYPIYRQTMMPYWIEWLLVVWLSGLLLEQLSEQQDRSGLAAIKVVNVFKYLERNMKNWIEIPTNLRFESFFFIISGGQYFSTFHCSYTACSNCNIFCTDWLERACLYPKSICRGCISNVLYSGNLRYSHYIFHKLLLKTSMNISIISVLCLVDTWFLEISSSVWSLGYYYHKSDCWYIEIHGSPVPFWSRIYNVGNGH